jgi:hemolysin activation/secretion protein
VSQARAQTPIPGGVEQELRRQEQQLEQRATPPKQQGPGVIGPARPTSPLLQPGGPKFVLKSVVFDGESKFISKQELDATIAPYLGRKVDFAGLQKLIAAINAIYAAKGIVTGIATLPPQDVKNGVVKIKLTEGRLEKMSVIGNVQTAPAYVLRRVEQPIGEVLDVPKLGRDVTWFNRTNEAQVRALLQPGTSFGLTDVNLAMTEVPTDTLQLFTDNQGVESVGRYQYGAYYKRSGTFGIDDRFTFYGTKSVEDKGNINGNVAYNLPFNTLGGRIGVSYTQGRTNIIHGPFADLKIQGDSKLGSVNISQPAWVDERWLLLANLATSYGITQSSLDQVGTTDTRTRKETAGFSLTNSDDNYSITIAPAASWAETHDEILETNKSYALYTGSLSGFGRLPLNFSVSMLGSWQYTNELTLPGDQLFQIGGPTTVRGYPTNTVAGLSGYYVNLEFHRNMSDLIQGLDIYAFIDRGEVYSTFPSHTLLQSAGGGFSWTFIPAITLEGFSGVPWNKVLEKQQSYQAYFRLTVRPLLFATK